MWKYWTKSNILATALQQFLIPEKKVFMLLDFLHVLNLFEHWFTLSNHEYNGTLIFFYSMWYSSSLLRFADDRSPTQNPFRRQSLFWMGDFTVFDQFPWQHLKWKHWKNVTFFDPLWIPVLPSFDLLSRWYSASYKTTLSKKTIVYIYRFIEGEIAGLLNRVCIRIQILHFSEHNFLLCKSKQRCPQYGLNRNSHNFFVILHSFVHDFWGIEDISSNLVMLAFTFASIKGQIHLDIHTF